MNPSQRKAADTGLKESGPSLAPGYAEASGSQGSVTQSGISGAQITITDDAQQQDKTGQDAATTLASLNRDVSTDKDSSNSLSKAWDGNKLQKQMQAEAQIVAEFGKNASKAIGDYAESKLKEAALIREYAKKETDEAKQSQMLQQATEMENNWKEGGAYRVALHTAVGGLAGGVQGAMGAGGAAISAEGIAEVTKDLPEPLKAVAGTVIAASIGAAAGGNAGAATAMNAEVNNRQLHPYEEDWLKKNAEKFAKKEGITEQEAMERLTQQALKEVDYLWRAQLSDGDDASAKTFLAQNQGTFTNDIGKEQKLFTASVQQLFRPEMFGDSANPAFYKQYAQSGISRTLSDGLAKELKDSGVDIKNSASKLAEVIRDNPRVVLDALWSVVQNLPESVVDGFKETGTAIGEGAAVALNDDISAKLNAIYGTDVSSAQKAILVLRITAALVDAVGAGKVVGAGGKVAGDATEAVAKAVKDKLDDVLSEAAEKAFLKSRGVVDPNTGKWLIDMKSLTKEQKMKMAELLGENDFKSIIPDGQKLARIPGIGETGIDDLYKVSRQDVDYVVIEYKFVGGNKTGAQVLGETKDGLQGSQTWITGSGRLEKSVGEDVATDVKDAIRAGRTETYVVTTRPNGATEIQVLDAVGKAKAIDTSKILGQIKNAGEIKP